MTRLSCAQNIPPSCREGVISVPEWRSTKARKVPVRVKTSSRTGTDAVVLDVAIDTTSSKDKRERKALTKSPHS